jgi:ribosomal-protein-alanine N-acetyltransferase
VHYRLYASQDFEPLYAIEEACFEPPLRFGRGLMRKLVNSARAATWIAEEDGHMAGFAIVEWAKQGGGIVAYIHTVEVAGEQRRRGVAGELLRRMEGGARAASAETMWLHVDAENAAAIRLYEAHGYVLQGREENYYARRRAALIYAKRIVGDAGSFAVPEGSSPAQF